MAWGLGSNQTTWTLPDFATRITKGQLQAGDVLIRNNPDNPGAGSHAVIFGGWTDSTHTRYLAYEQTRPGTVRRVTPYAYWNGSADYIPYRFNGISSGGTGGGGSSARFPGAGKFGAGANNAFVTRLGELLVQRGGSRFYSTGPGPVWSEADRRATKAFQKAQGWSGSDADGIPGPATWDFLVNGSGRSIPRGGSGGGKISAGFPGAEKFRPGQSSDHVLRLGQQLVRKGFSKYYSVGPSRTWTESDRRNVEAFQRAQGWRGAAADGYPGPETWRRLFA
ncbi:peptidoglycan-binding protein (plasmid) [Streptoverticillium reticulum]|uniref:peptidoglycan-binding protein n=1 Tax=Streptoverticillium reticulum TaxID=1433415 RepID=UPI0039BF6A95